MSAGGALIGGLVIKKARLSIQGILRFCVVFSAGVVVSALCILIHCERLDLAGVTVHYGSGKGFNEWVPPRSSLPPSNLYKCFTFVLHMIQPLSNNAMFNFPFNTLLINQELSSIPSNVSIKMILVTKINWKHFFFSFSFSFSAKENEDLASMCNWNCSCAFDNYSPVCGDDVTYLNPCAAGCPTEAKNEVRISEMFAKHP